MTSKEKEELVEKLKSDIKSYEEDLIILNKKRCENINNNVLFNMYNNSYNQISLKIKTCEMRLNRLKSTANEEYYDTLTCLSSRGFGRRGAF